MENELLKLDEWIKERKYDIELNGKGKSIVLIGVYSFIYMVGSGMAFILTLTEDFRGIYNIYTINFIVSLILLVMIILILIFILTTGIVHNKIPITNDLREECLQSYDSYRTNFLWERDYDNRINKQIKEFNK